MKLRHFLYGKSRATVDFRTLVKSSNIAESDLKYWVLKIGALMQELREFGMPGEDFMRLFIPRQNKDRERAAYEWAYVRVRTGADRSSFNYQAVILSAENLDQLFWQPWALDRGLFDGNTRDPRVRESLGEDGLPRPGREHNPAIIDIEFNDTSRRPQLSAEHKVAAERLVSSIGNPNAPDARWYLDEGQVGREGTRRIIASLLSRLHALDRPVPGFIMGLVSVPGHNSLTGSTHRSQARFPDILLASYKKEADSYFFPFENWRDATPEQQGAAVPFEEPDTVPTAPTTHGRYDDHSAQGDGLQANGRAAVTASGSEATGGAATPSISSQSGRMRAARATQDEDEAKRADRPEASINEETQISVYPDELLGEADNLRADESYRPHSFNNSFAASTSDSGRRRQSLDPSQPSAVRPKRSPAAKGAGAANGNIFNRVRGHLERPLLLQLALLVALLLFTALGTLAYTNDRKYRKTIEAKDKEYATLRAEYDTYKKGQESKPADAVVLTASVDKPIDSSPPPQTDSAGNIAELTRRMGEVSNRDTSYSANESPEARLIKAQAKIKELQDFLKYAKAELEQAQRDARTEKNFYEKKAISAEKGLQLATANIVTLNGQIRELDQSFKTAQEKATRLEAQNASASRNTPEGENSEKVQLRRDLEAAQNDLAKERTKTKELNQKVLDAEREKNTRLASEGNRDRESRAEIDLRNLKGSLIAICKDGHESACSTLKKYLGSSWLK